MGGGSMRHIYPGSKGVQKKLMRAEMIRQREQQKIEERQKEIDAEREKMELQKLADSVRDTDQNAVSRIEWLYEQTNNNQEDFLLGKKIEEADSINNDAEGKDKVFKKPQPSYSTCVDLVNKMKEDPLFMIKKKQLTSQRQLANNPARMRHLMKKNGFGVNYGGVSDRSLIQSTGLQSANNNVSNTPSSTPCAGAPSWQSPAISQSYKWQTPRRDVLTPTTAPLTPNQSSEDELERKRLEMTDNAKWRDQIRSKNMKISEEESNVEKKLQEKLQALSKNRPGAVGNLLNDLKQGSWSSSRYVRSSSTLTTPHASSKRED